MKIKFFLTAITAMAFMPVLAQLPGHDKVVQQFPQTGTGGNVDFYTYFTNWDENHPCVTADDNFYISRVRQAKRFVDTSTQFDPDMTQDRKLLWWCPAGVADNYWSSLPRYIFNADAFSAWSMIDYHGNWSDGVARVPGAFSDAAHRNGVQNGCIFFWDTTLSATSSTGRFFTDLNKTDATGDYADCRKFIRFMKYYGIDGIGINAEGNTSALKDAMMNVLEQLHRIATEEGWHFRVDWYDAATNTGSVYWQNALNTSNSNWFQRKTSIYPVSDVFFLNYNWYQSQLNTSKTVATNLGRSSYDVYAGFDIQGRGLSSVSGGRASQGWELLINSPLSVGIWGAHGKNMLFENSNEYGSDALSIQTLYQKKQEQFFYSGTRNVANAPKVTNTLTSMSTSNMKSFHGMSRFLTARSVLTTLPFVTYFNLGNGQRLWDEGEVTFEQEWYNLGAQNIMPTWRWWITDDAGNVPTQAISPELNYTDAWKGGSVLKFSGATTKSNVRLFKTQFDIAASNTVTLRYKNLSGNGTMRLMWSTDGKTLNTYEVPAGTLGEWTALQLTASKLGMTGTVKVLGLVFENTDTDYAVEIGEMSIVDNKSFAPAKPVITSTQVCGQRFDGMDVKLIWKSKDASADKPWEPVYNEDVDTWYFEVFAQAEGEEPVLVTTCSSWAAYVVKIPMGKELTQGLRCGVRAVAPDGITRSDITWTDYLTRNEESLTIADKIVVDKAVIKPNETFTVGFADPYHKPANFKITRAATDAVVMEMSNVTSVNTSISELGMYNVVVDNVTYPGLVCISPLSTGALPIIGNLTVDKAQAFNDENVTATLTVERLGEGKVSRGVVVSDPYMLRFSPAMCESPDFTVAFWIKPTGFAHGKFGTNLFNKRDWAGNWPHNNWGTIWMHIWPDVEVYNGVNPNIISLTQFANQKNNIGIYPNGNPHESPNLSCAANDMSLEPGTWYHVAFSISSTEQSLFINGKRVAKQSVNWAGLNTQNNCTHPQYCYIGGTNVYHGGFMGVVDDVQYWNKYTSDPNDFLLDAMKGYADREIPANLQGYWDFEDTPIAGSSYTEDGQTHTALSLFKNRGHNADLQAETMYLEGASGENPNGFAKTVNADNNVAGNTSLPGSINVITTTSWILPEGASGAEANGSNLISFTTAGEKPITARLENRWGFDERTVDVVISDRNPNGIETVKENTCQLTFNGRAITVLFAEGGNYTISVYTTNGSLLQQDSMNVKANEVTCFHLNTTGNCIITVRNQETGKMQRIKIRL